VTTTSASPRSFLKIHSDQQIGVIIVWAQFVKTKMGRSMTQAAVRIGANLGIDLRGGTPVKASGNCLIESVKGNIEERDIFDVKLTESSVELRLRSALEGERILRESPYRIEDYNEDEWSEGWNLLKNEGVWDVEYFGDLMIIALAHYIHKNILLINTKADCPKVTVILGDQFGKHLDSDAPVILAYSGDHYESLIPSTDKDEDKIKALIDRYIKGEDLAEKSDDDSNDDASNDNIWKTTRYTTDSVRKFPRFQIDNWKHQNYKDSNNCKPISSGLQHLVLSTTESAAKPVLGNDSPVLGKKYEYNDPVDNWRQCHPSRCSKFSSTIWEEEPVSIPIPITHVKTNKRMIEIPITRVKGSTQIASKQHQQLRNLWMNPVEKDRR